MIQKLKERQHELVCKIRTLAAFCESSISRKEDFIEVIELAQLQDFELQQFDPAAFLGSVKSEAKSIAARENGKKGGRPRRRNEI